MAAFLSQIESSLLARLQQIRTANGYSTEAGAVTSSGFVVDATGEFLNGTVAVDSLIVEPTESEASNHTTHINGEVTFTVYGLTKSATTVRLYEMLEDVRRAVKSADFHTAVVKVELLKSRFGPGESNEYFAVAIPLRITYHQTP